MYSTAAGFRNSGLILEYELLSAELVYLEGLLLFNSNEL